MPCKNAGDTFSMKTICNLCVCVCNILRVGWVSPLSCSDRACESPCLSCCPQMSGPESAQTPEPGYGAPSTRGTQWCSYQTYCGDLSVIINYRRSVTHLVFIRAVSYSLQVANQELESVVVMIWEVSDLRKQKRRETCWTCVTSATHRTRRTHTHHALFIYKLQQTHQFLQGF